jgi:hypothetical protein
MAALRIFRSIVPLKQHFRIMSPDLFAQAIAPQGSETPPPASMLVFAHPDDEIVAVGARLGRFRSAVFVHGYSGAGHASSAAWTVSVNDMEQGACQSAFPVCC